MKTILIISGGIEAADAAKRARDMGLCVVVSDSDRHAPGFAHADHRLFADVHGPKETADAAERFHKDVRPIDGVICVAADAPLTAATVAERLGLPGITTKTAMLASDKLAMKHCFAAAGVKVPWFAPVADPIELRVILAERGSNLVIKPVDSRRRSGVQRLAKVSDIVAAYQVAENHSPTGRVMIEDYLAGPQVSTESLVIDGLCFTPGLSDRNYEFLERHAPYFVDNGGDLPSRLPAAIQDKIKALVARAAAAIGMRDGTVKGDIVVHDGEPHVIELGPRLSGGFFCSREIPLNTGVDFIGCAIRVALGMPVRAGELEPIRQRAVIQRYAFPPPGRVVDIRGAEAARSVPGIADLVVTARPGDMIPPAGDKRPSAAMVLATGATHDAALAAANAALSRIEILTR